MKHAANAPIVSLCISSAIPIEILLFHWKYPELRKYCFMLILLRIEAFKHRSVFQVQKHIQNLEYRSVQYFNSIYSSPIFYKIFNFSRVSLINFNTERVCLIVLIVCLLTVLSCGENKDFLRYLWQE